MMTPQLPDLEAWAIFAKVVERGSFSQAAVELGLAKTTVSKTVTRLEERLQTSLLHRTTRKLSPTQSGLVSLERATRILMDGKAIEADILAEAAVPHGLVRIVSTAAFGTEALAPLLPHFLELYPEVTLDLCLTDDSVDLVADGFDIGIQIGPQPDSSLRVTHLFSFRRPLVAAPALLDRLGRPSDPSDLSSYPAIFATNARSSGEWQLSNASGVSAPISMCNVLSVNNPRAMIPALLAGLGASVIPEFFVRRELEEGSLEHVLPGWSAPPGPIDMLTPPGRARPARVRVLMDFLRERFAAHFWGQGVER
jgi:DNA-binding transcriptional LysR family regulator